MRSEHRDQKSRPLPGWKSKSYMANLGSLVEALISSWLPHVTSELRMSHKPAWNATYSKMKSFKRQRGDSEAQTDTASHKAGKVQGVSTWSRKSLTSLGSSGKTCKKCHWARKRRIVSRRRARRSRGTRTKWTPHSPSEPNAGAVFPTKPYTKDADAIRLLCLLSLLLMRSSLLHQIARTPLASEAQRLGIFLRSSLKGPGFVPHPSGFRLPPFPFGRRQKLCCHPRGSSPGESHTRDARTLVGNDEMSREVRYMIAVP